jgi:hypothetical protein
VLDGTATLSEIERHYSIDDLVLANEAADAKAEAETAYYQSKQKR